MTSKDFFNRYGLTYEDIVERIAEAIPTLDKAGDTATADNLFEVVNVLRDVWELGE